MQSEYGAPKSAKLSAFYRGGSYVEDIPQNDDVPETGLIKLSDLDGSVDYDGVTLALSGDTSPNGSCTSIGAACTATTNAIRCTASGGISPYVITTEKKPGETTFTVVNGTPDETSRPFAYKKTNSSSTATYTSQYRVKVVDAADRVYYTGYFAVSTVNTYIPTLTVALTGDTTPNGSCSATGSGCTARTTTWITATGSGGSGTKVYTLQYRSGTEFTITTSSNGRSWKFSTTSGKASATYNGVYRIRVTDGSGQTAYSSNFNVQNIHTYSPTPITFSDVADIACGTNNPFSGSNKVKYAGGDSTAIASVSISGASSTSDTGGNISAGGGTLSVGGITKDSFVLSVAGGGPSFGASGTACWSWNPIVTVTRNEVSASFSINCSGCIKV